MNLFIEALAIMGKSTFDIIKRYEKFFDIDIPIWEKEKIIICRRYDESSFY